MKSLWFSRSELPWPSTIETASQAVQAAPLLMGS